MGVGADVYMYDVVVKNSRSLSHLLMSSCDSYLVRSPYNIISFHLFSFSHLLSILHCCSVWTYRIPVVRLISNTNANYGRPME